jgi:hypothetical protein
MDTEPVRVPVAVGLKVTLIVQLAAAARLDPQVLVCAKSLAFAPVMLMPILVIEVVVLLLVMVMVCAALVVPTLWLLNVRLAGESWTKVPVPVNDTVWGLPLALSVMERLAVRLFLFVGVKVTLRVQLDPAATLVPQVFVWLKSPLFVPVIVMLVMLSDAVPVLDKVTTWAALLVPSNWVPNVSVAGERLTAGAVPVPDRLTA